MPGRPSRPRLSSRTMPSPLGTSALSTSPPSVTRRPVIPSRPGLSSRTMPSPLEIPPPLGMPGRLSRPGLRSRTMPSPLATPPPLGMPGRLSRGLRSRTMPSPLGTSPPSATRRRVIPSHPGLSSRTMPSPLATPPPLGMPGRLSRPGLSHDAQPAGDPTSLGIGASHD
jgi:hypothetical protein